MADEFSSAKEKEGIVTTLCTDIQHLAEHLELTEKHYGYL